MAQILLGITLIVVVSTVTASCWRSGQKRLASGVAIGGALVLIGALLAVGRQARLQPEIDLSNVEIRLSSVNVTGAGWRLTGKITNNSDIAISKVTGVVNIRSPIPCEKQACDLLSQQPFQLLMHVGSGQTYPFRIALHDVSLPATEHPKSEDSKTSAQYMWELKPTSALGYADSNTE